MQITFSASKPINATSRRIPATILEQKVIHRPMFGQTNHPETEQKSISYILGTAFGSLLTGGALGGATGYYLPYNTTMIAGLGAIWALVKSGALTDLGKKFAKKPNQSNH